MKRPLLAVVLISTFAATAQDVGALNGDWSAKYTTANGAWGGAEVKIAASTGSWQALGRSATNPCVGRKHPMEVEFVDPDTLRLVLHGSKVMNGCEDIRLEFKRTGPSSFEGLFPDGRKILLTRN